MAGSAAGLGVLAAAMALPSAMGGGLGVWDMVSGADLIVKIVLLGLLLFSIASWTIIIGKSRALKAAERADREFEEIFWNADSLSTVYSRTRNQGSSPMAAVFRLGYEELHRLLAGRPGETVAGREFSQGILEILDRTLGRVRASEMIRLEGATPLLASTATTAPFIGLFGTVWGIMNSFRSIGAVGAANLATVAPGIAEALIATATGLFVAIPAGFFFNYFTRRLQVQEERLTSFGQELMNVVASDLLQKPGAVLETSPHAGRSNSAGAGG